MINKKQKTETSEKAKPAEKIVEKTKVPKGKKSVDNTFLSSLIILVVSATIAASLISGILFWKAQEMIVENNELVKQQLLDSYTKMVNLQVTLMQKEVRKLSDFVANDSRFFALDENAIRDLQESIKRNLPDSMDIKIFLFGQYDIDRDSYPPVNFATQKQLLAAESNTTMFPLYYKDVKGDYFSVASAIRHPVTNELLYTILASYSAEKVFANLPNKVLANTQVNLTQTFERGDKQDFYKIGTVAQQKNKQVIDTLHPSWKVEYISNQKEMLLQNVYLAIALIFGVFIGFTALAAVIVVSMLKNSFSADSSLIYEFVRSSGQKIIDSNLFKTTLLKALYTQLAEIQFTPSGKSSNVRKPAHKKDENFDIDISSGDENLFGGSNLPEVVDSDSSKISPSIFRAYDIRGIVDETLTAEGVKLIGQAIGSESIAQGENTVIIARDGRLSGPTLSEALKQGILASGADVIDIGMVPTPILYFACKTLDARSGVMLTGSHNPANHNGLKIVINGVTLAENDIQKLRQAIESDNLASGEGNASTQDVMDAYIATIENDVILAQPMNVVIDCGNGVTGVMAEKLFETIGCHVTPLYNEVDGNFPNHHPDPGQPANLQDLIAKVQQTKAHLGIAFDGDGDRLGIVTNTGKIIWPDRLMMLYAKDILLRNPGADIIFDVKCSNTLADTIRKQGGRPLMWKTGHSLIKAKLMESGAQLAGEMSGHIFFNDRWYGFDDGLYSAARLLEIVSTDSKSVDEIFSQFPEMVSTPELNIAVDDESKFDLITMLASVGDFGDGAKTDIDGIRIDYAYGWGLVRASNTTANLVTRFEAKSGEQLAEIQARFKEQLLKIQSDLDIPF